MSQIAPGSQPPAELLSDVMSFIDSGLYPFADCTKCTELMPVSVGHGALGTLLVSCCRCKTAYGAKSLTFLTAKEAGALGWRFQFTGDQPVN